MYKLRYSLVPIYEPIDNFPELILKERLPCPSCGILFCQCSSPAGPVLSRYQGKNRIIEPSWEPVRGRNQNRKELKAEVPNQFVHESSRVIAEDGSTGFSYPGQARKGANDKTGVEKNRTRKPYDREHAKCDRKDWEERERRPGGSKTLARSYRDHFDSESNLRMHPSRSSIFNMPAITNASDLGRGKIMAGSLTTPTPASSTSIQVGMTRSISAEQISTGTIYTATASLSASDTWDRVTGGQKEIEEEELDITVSLGSE